MRWCKTLAHIARTIRQLSSLGGLQTDIRARFVYNQGKNTVAVEITRNDNWMTDKIYCMYWFRLAPDKARWLITCITVHIQPAVSVYWISRVYCLATDVEGSLLSNQTAPGPEHKNESIQNQWRNKKRGSVVDPGWTCSLLFPQMMPDPWPPAEAPLAVPVAERGPASPKNT